MPIPYHESYLGKLRQLIGKQKVFAIGVRAIVQNQEGHVLLVQRSDNGRWVMPGRSIELEESLNECIKREVFEESGLIVESAQAIAIYSAPRYSFVTAYGDPYQMFSTVFIIEKWSGELQKQTDETVDAGFFPLDNLPETSNVYLETLSDLKSFRENGQFIVK